MRMRVSFFEEGGDVGISVGVIRADTSGRVSLYISVAS
jgi:hypothetical protein